MTEETAIRQLCTEVGKLTAEISNMKGAVENLGNSFDNFKTNCNLTHKEVDKRLDTVESDMKTDKAVAQVTKHDVTITSGKMATIGTFIAIIIQQILAYLSGTK